MRYYLLIISLLIPLLSEAQLTATGMKSVRYTTYPSSPAVKDPVFIYCNSTGTEKATLSAVRPGGSGNYNYRWYSWNDTDNDFATFLKTDSEVPTSSITDLGENGYKVVIDKNGIFDTSLVGWVFFDKPPIVHASLQQQLCTRVALKGDTSFLVQGFYYFDPGTGASVKLANEKTFLWSSDPASSIPRPDAAISPVTYSPPLENVTYKLTVNNLGCSSESSFFYESIHVKADFTVDPTEGEAPLEVSFTDNSIRGETYLWEFGDGKDSTSSLMTPEPHIYYKPGEYSVKLTITSALGCVDSMRFESIIVDDSELDIPNVFTPDGDGLNDNFIVLSKSLRFISVEVFSRSGLKVYSFYGEGESLREWTGWDGRINNTSVKAGPGVYFYSIHAYGWDDVDYNSKEQKGYVYLYR